MTDTDATLGSLIRSVYLPSLFFAVGQGAVLPVIALTVIDLGGSVGLASTVVALNGIGRMVFNLPAGKLVDRFGEQRAMIVGTVLLSAALLGAVVSTHPLAFAASTFVMGCGWAVWLLARLAYVSEVMPFHLRGRALASLGGVHRIGTFLGPLLGAGAIAVVGLDGAYLTHLVLGLGALAVLVSAPDPRGHGSPPTTPNSLAAVARDNLRTLSTVGLAASCLSALRACRHAVLPLWGAAIGLDATAVSLIFGLTAAMDMTLFYPAGAVSDRYGRRAVALPCLGILSLGYLLLPLSATFTQMLLVGLVMGAGNGLGSGIVMTLGADNAPDGARAAFLSVWRTVTDIGAAAGPVAAGAIAGIATLGAASVGVAGIGALGMGIFARALPRSRDR